MVNYQSIEEYLNERWVNEIKDDVQPIEKIISIVSMDDFPNRDVTDLFELMAFEQRSFTMREIIDAELDMETNDFYNTVVGWFVEKWWRARADNKVEVIVGENYWTNTDLEVEVNCSECGAKCTEVRINLVFVSSAPTARHRYAMKGFCAKHTSQLLSFIDEINKEWKVVEL